MPKFGKEAKKQAMMLWADGKTLREVAKEIGCNENTVALWRDANDPVNWNDFREKADMQAADAALKEMRREAMLSTREHLRNTKELRTLARYPLQVLAKMVTSGEVGDLGEYLKNLKVAASIFGDIQQQQSAIFNLPTHRIALNNEPRPLLGDQDLENMSERQLVEICLNVLEVKDEKG